MLRRLVRPEDRDASSSAGRAACSPGSAALLALYFAATGRRGRLLLQLTGAAIVLGALSILIGSI